MSGGRRGLGSQGEPRTGYVLTPTSACHKETESGDEHNHRNVQWGSRSKDLEQRQPLDEVRYDRHLSIRFGLFLVLR